MFGHNFKYTFKVLMRNRMLLFWTFVFPLVLGTMFKLAFSNIENSEKLNVIPIAIVDNEDYQRNEAFRRTFDDIGEQMFYVLYHPAAALYNGGLRQTLLEDFKKIPEVIGKLKRKNESRA